MIVYKCMYLQESVISCVGQVDGSHLLGDESKGRLLMLFVDSDEGVESAAGSGSGFTGMKLEVLGECSTPHCLAYLDNGVVFIGSRLGDSQLVKVKFISLIFNFQLFHVALDIEELEKDLGIGLKIYSYHCLVMLNIGNCNSNKYRG